MTLVTGCRSVSLAVFVVMVLVAIPSADAQSRQTPNPSASIQEQIQRSMELQRQALQSLNDQRRVEQLIDKAYAELRAAVSGMVIQASGAKFQDPLLSIQTQSGERALALLQRAGDTLRQNRAERPASPDQEGTGQPVGSRAYLDEVRSNLEQALRLTSALVF